MREKKVRNEEKMIQKSREKGEKQAGTNNAEKNNTGINNAETEKGQRTRHGIQLLWTLLTNSYLTGFIHGKLYKGKLKNFCVPGMNCYSCPGALGACPIGAMQAVIGSWNFKLAFYVSGFLMLVGALIGRLVCGFLCPFGLLQDVLHKLPFPKKIKTFRGDRMLRKLKYVILILFVILMPMFLVDLLGQGAPYFCKLICPVGTLEGGIPLVLFNKALHSALGWLYAWKVFLLAVILFLSVLVYRPFCKYLCPLGGIYSVFNKVSVFRYRVDMEKCVSCGKCAVVCGMGCNPVQDTNDLECIRCGKCRQNCPTGAISSGFCKKRRKENE